MTDIDQQTIDRVCVGLADLAMQQESLRRAHAGHQRTAPLPISPSPFGLLMNLLGVTEWKTPDWATRARRDHHGTPEELVSALRELIAIQEPRPPGMLKQGVCVICGGEMSLLTPEFFADRGMPDKPGGWIHNGVSRDHPATPQGEPE